MILSQSKTIFLKTKIESHGDEVTDFYDKKIAMVDSNHTYLPAISLFSARKYFLSASRYIEKKIIRHMNDYLSDFSSSDASDEE